MPTLVFLKLGGSLITDKTQEAAPRPEAIRAAAVALSAARRARPDLVLLLGHGSGSFGHFAAHRSGFGQPGNWLAYAETGAAAARLNRIVTDICLETGLPVVSIQPSATALCRDGVLVRLDDAPIRAALAHGLVPLIYGDVALDETRGMTIASTEMLFGYLAARYKPDLIILAGEVDGVYSADPRTCPDARLIEEITPGSLMSAQVAGSHGVDVTGGMTDKVQRMLALAKQEPGTRILIAGAGAIYEALIRPDQARGTRVRA